MKYIPTIGLEIHAELKTHSKMFCACKNDPDQEKANVNICPICLGHPGTLPVLNMEAIRHVLRVGLAVNMTHVSSSSNSDLDGGGSENAITDFTEWDRKNYFYPDIPKGYQISQYKYPLVSGGELAGVAIERIHLEEDTAASTHDVTSPSSLRRGAAKQRGGGVIMSQHHPGLRPPLLREEGEQKWESFSLVNFNRAGVPLMELVTKPVIHDAGTAVRFAKELQLLLRYLNAGDANMEKGEMRVEANISVMAISDNGRETSAGEGFVSSDPLSPDSAKATSGKAGGDPTVPFRSSDGFEERRMGVGSELTKPSPADVSRPLGTKTEVKNLNSFRAVEKAIEYEIERQTSLLEKGEQVIQETRGWDDVKNETYSQRSKESSHDYRYFPDPDIPKMKLSEIPEFAKDTLMKDLPELPWIKRARFQKDFAMTDKEVAVFVENPRIADYYESVISKFSNPNSNSKSNSKIPSNIDAEHNIDTQHRDIDVGHLYKLTANYLLSDYIGFLKKEVDEKVVPAMGTIAPDSFAELMQMTAAGELSSRGAKDMIVALYRCPTSIIKDLAEKNGLLQKSSAQDLEPIIDQVLKEHTTVVAEYKAGKTASLQFLIGQAMKATKGAANPNVVRELLVKKIG